MALTASLGIQAPSALPRGGRKPTPRADPLCHGWCWRVRLGNRSPHGCLHAGPRLARTDPCACDGSVPMAWVLTARLAVQRPPGGPPSGQGVWRKAARMRTQRTWVTVLTVPCLGLLSALVSPPSEWTVAVMWLSWTTRWGARGDHFWQSAG